MLSLDNAYYIPNLQVIGHVCKTNIPSNTALRGCGVPQGFFFIDVCINHIAHVLGKSSLEVSVALQFLKNSPVSGCKLFRL